VGSDGFTTPGTQPDLFCGIAGSADDVVFDTAVEITGFIDGTKNPSLSEAPKPRLVPEGRPGRPAACC